VHGRNGEIKRNTLPPVEVKFKDGAEVADAFKKDGTKFSKERKPGVAHLYFNSCTTLATRYVIFMLFLICFIPVYFTLLYFTLLYFTLLYFILHCLMRMFFLVSEWRCCALLEIRFQTGSVLPIVWLHSQSRIYQLVQLQALQVQVFVFSNVC